MLITLVAAAFLPAAPLQSAPAPGAERPRTPDLVLVTIDTLRRDHLGCYGYLRATSPRIDALAARSVQFEAAFAPMATTFPSHLTLLTGLHPHQHGHTSNPDAVRRPYRSGAGKLSAAEVLAGIGYRTAGFVSSVVLSERTGIGAGFQTYDAPAVQVGNRVSSETVERALTWLGAVPAEAPVFLWVHLWDVHEPNTPAGPYADLFTAGEELRAWVRARGIDPSELAREFAGQRSIGERFFGLEARGKEAPPPRERAGLRQVGRRPREKGPVSFTIDEAAVLDLFDRYDACVRAVDDQVGRLIDALEARGRWQRSVFVFTADHGQSLGENRHLGHGTNTQVNVAVPLVIHFPEGTVPQPARAGGLVSLVDALPTVLARIEHEELAPLRAQLAGEDVLRPGFAREHVLTARATEFHGGDPQPYESALFSRRWKYVREEGAPGRLYDLDGAGEGVDVAAQHADIARELDTLLSKHLAGSLPAAQAEEPVDPEAAELLEKLEDLGYGGGD